MKYKFKPVNIKVDDPNNIEFPVLHDRIIEKRGHVITFSMNEIKANTEALLKQKKEQEAMFKHRNAVIENIEHHHPFVKDLTDEQRLTVWMYQDAKGNRDIFKKNLDSIEKQLKDDEEEVAEIIKQLPELADVKSADVIDGEVKIVGDE